MTKIKLCGLSRPCDIETANKLRPEYIGFVFSKQSRRYISFDRAGELKKQLVPEIKAVGVFTDEAPETVAELLNENIIDIAQLHGSEDDGYIRHLKRLTDKEIIQAFRITSEDDVRKADQSLADHILLDSGAGTGAVFDWDLVKTVKRPCFLAGGLSPHNVAEAIRTLRPFAVDVSSGIETQGCKDKEKMAAFIAAVREVNKR